jgi:uncharacterized membrane protein YhdT
MAPLLVFYIHTIAAVTAFTHQYREEGFGAGVLAVGFLAIIFSVGWSITTFFLKMLIDEKGFGIWFNRDAMSLTLLTFGEAIFYYLFLRGLFRKKRA